MNSVAIVEHPAGERRLYYMVTIVSNVLRKNSGTVHMELATRIQRLVESLHPAASPSPSPSTPHTLTDREITPSRRSVG
jgi:hypothetical protein